MTTARSLCDRLLASVAQIGGDFVGQHLFESESEKVRRVPAVRPGGDITASTCGSAGTAMTCCTAVGQPCANRPIGVEVADAVAFIASLSLQPREFALEELPSTPDGAKRVPL